MLMRYLVEVDTAKYVIDDITYMQMDSPPMRTDVTAITRGAEDVLEIVGVHEQLDHNSQRDHITV